MRFKFDRFVIDGGRRIMWRGDEEIHVAPKTLDFLLSLLAQAPNAVSKTELMATLWPDTHIAEATLTGVVADAREALGRRWPGAAADSHAAPVWLCVYGTGRARGQR